MQGPNPDYPYQREYAATTGEAQHGYVALASGPVYRVGYVLRHPTVRNMLTAGVDEEQVTSAQGKPLQDAENAAVEPRVETSETSREGQASASTTEAYDLDGSRQDAAGGGWGRNPRSDGNTLRALSKPRHCRSLCHVECTVLLEVRQYLRTLRRHGL